MVILVQVSWHTSTLTALLWKRGMREDELWLPRLLGRLPQPQEGHPYHLRPESVVSWCLWAYNKSVTP